MSFPKIIIAIFSVVVLIIMVSCSGDDDCVSCPEDPTTIVDLSADLPDFSSVVLTWTAPAGALEYDLRYATSAITEGNWASATQVDNEPDPQQAGSIEILKVEGLASNESYSLALKFRLGQDDWSGISNVVECFTSVFDSRNMIAYNSNLDGDYEIFIANADGTNARQVTFNLFNESAPVWLSSGLAIAYGSTQGGSNQLFVTELWSGVETNISNNTYGDNNPSLAYPSNRVVFATHEIGLSNIFKMNIDGSQRVALTSFTDSLDIYPDWSPDGLKIAFCRLNQDVSTAWRLYTMDANGTNVVRLTDGSGYADHPDWSPDGSQIAFVWGDNESTNIFIIDDDGANPINLTNDSSINSSPCWSPDGTRIAFCSDRDGDDEIYIINADGTGLVQVTHNEVDDGFPCWSPIQ